MLLSAVSSQHDLDRYNTAVTLELFVTVTWHLTLEDAKQEPGSTSLTYLQTVTMEKAVLEFRWYNRAVKEFKLLEVWQIYGINFLDCVALGKNSGVGIS